MPSCPLPLAVTMGEPAGIGGELTIMAWTLRHERTIPPFFVYDDPKRLQGLMQRIAHSAPVISITRVEETFDAWQEGLPVMSLTLPQQVEPGRPHIENAPAVLQSIDHAVTAVQRGQATAVVTNPIHKEILYNAGFRCVGHTDYLASLVEDEVEACSAVMMLVSPELRVVPLTIHLSLREAITSLSTPRIVDCGRTTLRSLMTDFALESPRLAVLGINPHAGEHGWFGREEIDIIAPAVEILRSEGFSVWGPLAPDSVFHQESRTSYDAMLCMYHDQAMIPLKTLAFHTGVNVTLGLPFVRTSPDHGTAFPIAGTGTANPSSFMAALELAAWIADNRRRRKET